MSACDSFTVFLRDLAAGEVEFRALNDGRHVLQITRDVDLYVRPDQDDLPAVVAGLRKLAATATQMADALDGVPPFAPAPATPAQDDAGRAIVADLDEQRGGDQ
jgi:hypothetical protein